MIYVWTSLCLVILILMFGFYRDLAAPPILSALIWIFVYVLMILSKTQYTSSRYIRCFGIALICFTVGFVIAVPKRMRPVDVEAYNVRINPTLSKVVLLFEYIATVSYVSIYRNDIIGSVGSLWTNIRNSEVEMGYFLGVLVNAFPIISATALYVYFKNPEKKNKNFFLMTLPPLFCAMLTSNRTTWFYVLSTFIFVIIFTRQLKNKTIIKLAGIGLIAIAILFASSTLAKFSNMMTTSSNADKIQYYVNVYFESPPLAFLQWLENSGNFEYGYGKYTFRFFVALLRVVFPSIEVPNTVMDFTVVDGMRTNVYTALHWYAMDGGLIWTYIVQFFIGLMFGVLYKKVRATNNPNRLLLLMVSMLMSIILGQFFADQFMSHLSPWIQRVCWAIFCCKIMVKNIDVHGKRMSIKLFKIPRVKFVIKR